MDASEIRRLDEKSLKLMKDGNGPVDECLCSVLSPPNPDKKEGLGSSIKRAFKSGFRSKQFKTRNNGNFIEIPATKRKGIFKRDCGKCGCNQSNLNNALTSLKIENAVVDVSSYCSCPRGCLPERVEELLKNNIQVTIEHCNVPEVKLNDEHIINDNDLRQVSSEPQLPQMNSQLSQDAGSYGEFDYESVWSDG